MKVGIVGCGAIGQLLCELIPKHLPNVTISAVVEREERHARLRGELDPSIHLVSSVSTLLDLGLDLVIECAGHAALQAAGPTVLENGTDLLVVSVGALADPDIEAALRRAADAGAGKIRIPAGALGGLDVLGAAKHAGLDRVTYTSNKSLVAWRGTPAEEMINLEQIKIATTFFIGNAREAARLFPQNANVAAAVALGGVGFEKTEVRLAADPHATANTHRIEAVGPFGEINIRIAGKPLPANAKSSMLAPYSVIRSLANMSQTIAIA